MTTSTWVTTIAGNELRLGRALAVTERNATLLRSTRGYGWLLTAGIAEPVFYLIALGWGVGRLVGDISLPDGSTVPYLTFVAPALLAASAMTGALAETANNFFAKLRYLRHYESVLNTPVTPGEVALGELGWAVTRGAIYSVVFLVSMALLGMTTPLLALAALPAALLVGLALGGLGMAISSRMRNWQDFEYVGSVQFALFLFSGTFIPVESYPEVLQIIVKVTPLYQGVALVRGITLAQFTPELIGNALYLVVLAAGTIVLASRRLHRLFWR